MKPSRLSKNSGYFLTLAVLIVAGSALALKLKKNESTPIATVATATPIITAVPTALVTPSNILTAPPTITPTASTSDPVGLPSTYQAFLQHFYDAYKQKDSQKLLSTFMTPPSTQSEKEVQSLLWKGQDLNGVDGGPTLFLSSVASAVVQSYSITSSQLTSANHWKVAIKENASVDGKIAQRNRVITLIDDKGILIDNYMKSVASGKYSGFLND